MTRFKTSIYSQENFECDRYARTKPSSEVLAFKGSSGDKQALKQKWKAHQSYSVSEIRWPDQWSVFLQKSFEFLLKRGL